MKIIIIIIIIITIVIHITNTDHTNDTNSDINRDLRLAGEPDDRAGPADPLPSPPLPSKLQSGVFMITQSYISKGI